MTLADLKDGQEGIITKVRGRGAFRKRITDMGFIKGKSVRVIKNAPLKDPVEYKLMDYNVSLRRSEASLIDVAVRDAAEKITETFSGNRHARVLRKNMDRKGKSPSSRASAVGNMAAAFSQRGKTRHAKTIRIALVGNPNSGKTTIFNHVSGSRERVGNYAGVTVDAKEARVLHGGYLFCITDLPGTYSITDYSPEELFVRNAIIKNKPDVVVNVIDASNIERNLYLTTQLIELNLTVVVALNMHDELKKKGDEFDYDTLGGMLGIPFVPTVGSKGEGMRELYDRIIDVFEQREGTVRRVNINYGRDIEKALASIEQLVCDNCALESGVPLRYAALKLLEKDTNIEKMLAGRCEKIEEIFQQVKNLIGAIEVELKEDTPTLIADARYGFIAGALKETYRRGSRPGASVSEKIDFILTHRIIGVPIFLFALWLTFQLTFSLGRYPMNLIQVATSYLSQYTYQSMTPGLLRELITNGILPGVGGVMAFVPNIFILFFMISLMEDTGYMSRAAFIMDRLMHSIGLHGKSFIPLILGFGCNVPALMATRTLESRKDRLLTMLIIPFMSCSARLPVYVLFISAFFSSYAGSMLLMLYLFGIVVAVISAMLMKKTVFREAEVPFVMELPPYRVPHLKNTLRHMWERGIEYLKKIGGIVLIASVLIWALSRFPGYPDGSTVYPVDERARLEHSYIGRIGKFIDPAIQPLGFDWKMGTGILTGLAAKEITVSTLGILYHADKDSAEGNESLVKKIQEETNASGPMAGQRIFGRLNALGYMVFILLYLPCVATLITMKKESGSWKWPVFSALFSTTVAWITAFFLHQIGMLLR